MSDKPEALRLAAALEQGKYLLSVERNSTAAELRRLHAVEVQYEKIMDALFAQAVALISKADEGRDAL